MKMKWERMSSLTVSKECRRQSLIERDVLNVENRSQMENIRKPLASRSKSTQCLDGRTRSPSTCKTTTRVIIKVAIRTPMMKNSTQKKSAKKMTSRKKSMSLVDTERLAKELQEAEGVEVAAV